MKTIEIKNRFTRVVIWVGEAESLRDAVVKAIAARADLAGAYLAGADLAGADLAGAYLAGADLAGADLAGAYLAGADLAGADLARADLAGAYLAGADLAGAKHYDGKDHVDPKTPFVRKPMMSRKEHAQMYRERHPDVPIGTNLDQQILNAIEAGGSLDMSSWHACETTHCRAGWAIHLAGKAGYELEKKMGHSAIAGRMIYLASVGRHPHFYATNQRALADIKRCAAEEIAESGETST